MRHASTRIRWYRGLGYEVKEIASYLGVRYQQVRNVVTTEPKRAAREDLPAFVIELLDLETDLEAMENQALMTEMAAQRAQDRQAKKATNRARRALRTMTAEASLPDEYTDETISPEDLDRLDNS